MDQQDQGIMTYFDAEAHSFVMRIWRENRDDPADPAEWRGWIEHVQSEERLYFRDIGDIPHIVSSYLGDIAELDNKVFMPIGPKGAS
jgi:hypothetical protein